MSGQFRLMRERRFAPFFWTQFLGAANDNLLKFAFTLLVTYHAAEWGGADPSTVGFLLGALFIAPFLLLSATAGQLADKLDKAWLMRRVKELEIAIMAIATFGLLMHAPLPLYTAILLLGVHSTIFGPAKYAYLPQHLREEELTGGNGMVEMGTFVAILLGTVAGGLLAKVSSVTAWPIAAACLAIAISGRTAAQFIPRSPSDDPALKIDWNPIAVTWRNLQLGAQQRAVFNSLLGISWLWFFGTIVLTSFAPFAHQVLGGDENVVTLLLMTFSLGIGLGSIACERLSGRKVEIGLVPFGSIGMTVFALDLYFASRGLRPNGEETVSVFLANARHWRVMADLFLLALFGGFYSVPLYALIQARAQPAHRARIIAANNILNALFMIVASLFAIALLKSGFTIPQLFLVLAILNAAVAAHIYMLVPEFLMRFLCWILVHSIYRLEKSGIENIPEKGPAMLVCNHVSFVDPLVILAASPRPIRFVMDHRIFSTPIVSFVFRTGKAIPIAPAKEDAKLLEAAYDEVSKTLRAGELVAIFPEGRITDTGELYPFRSGIERIVERDPVPVIPIAVRGLWGSFFSRKGGPAFSKPGRLLGIFRKIAVVAGPAVAPAVATRAALQEIVGGLRGDWR
ncbi:MAG TPA: MFS transporter [Usitatibacter sp.]|nr:MFS transporter [Usitatibacter sp.]